MKRNIRVALLALLSLTAVTVYSLTDSRLFKPLASKVDLGTVDFGRILDVTKNFIKEQLNNEISQESIESEVRELIERIPTRVLGFDVDILRGGTLDAQSAEITQELLNQAEDRLNQISAFVAEPETGLSLIELGHNLIKEATPERVDNTIDLGLNLIRKMIQTNSPDREAIEFLEEILTQARVVVKNMESYQAANNTLVGYPYSKHIPEFRAIVEANLPIIIETVKRNLPEIKAILESANKITGDDLASIADTVQNIAQELDAALASD